MDAQTAGALATGAGSLWSAFNQNQTNGQNLDAQQAMVGLQAARQAQVSNYVTQMMQQGANPYAAQLMSMLGMQAPNVAPITGGRPAGQTNVPQNPPYLPSGTLLNARLSPTTPVGGNEPPVTGTPPVTTTPPITPNSPPVGGNEPSVGTPPFVPNGNLGGGMFQAPTPITGGGYNASQATSPMDVISQLVSGPQIDLGGFSAGNRAFNSGQDALLQAISRGPTSFLQDPSVTSALNQSMSGPQFNNTELFGALDQQSQQNLQQQMSNLQGSVGSFGARLGSSLYGKQAQATAQAATQLALQKQQLASQSFENAQSRQLQAAGLGAQRESTVNNFGLNLLGQNASAAASLGQLGMSQAQLLAGLAQANQQTNMQGQLANQSAGLNAGQMNQQTALQTALANMGALNNAGQFNASQNMAGQQFNAQQGQNWNQFMMGGLTQANAMQQAQQGQNLGLLSLLAGLQAPNAPMAQPSALPGAIGDIGSLMMFLPMLQSLGKK